MGLSQQGQQGSAADCVEGVGGAALPTSELLPAWPLERAVWQSYIGQVATAFSLDKFTLASPLARAEAVQAGIPASAVRALADRHALSIADIARVLGPRRTLDRRLRDDVLLTPDESDRYARLVANLKLAEDVFGDKAKAADWLRSPRRVFDGAIPFDLLRTESGGRIVENHLLRALHGFFA
jgi:putative toxin-antitoxin system antitoxin component (TIGR02293 family)